MNCYQLVCHSQKVANDNGAVKGPGIAKPLAFTRPGVLPRHLSARALRDAMATYGVTVGQLAIRCSVDTKRVARWRDGQRIDQESLAAMGAVGLRYLELLEVERMIRRVG